MATIGTGIDPGRRLESLDVLRGVTIAGMLLVNNPGSWSYIYGPLEHAAWNGWTPTDLVFPFFLFMVGMAMMYSFPKRLERGASRKSLFGHVVRRGVALMLLGWWGGTWSGLLWPGPDSVFARADAGAIDLASGILLRLGFATAALGAVVLLAGTRRPRRWATATGLGLAGFLVGSAVLGFADPLHGAIAGFRVPGVLVRIAWCYVLASAIYFLTPSPRALLAWIGGLLGLYLVWMTLVPIPGFGMPDLSRGFPTAATPRGELFSNWCFYIDYHLLGSHTWGARQLTDETGRLIWSFDPEGILSTMSAVGSVLFGILAGMWMRRPDRSDEQRLNGLLIAAAWLLLIGVIVGIWMPINKRIWTSSYTLFTSGMALLCLGVLYHAVDLHGVRRWAGAFRSYGRNAIFAFVASGMMAVAMGRIQIGTSGEGTISLKAWCYGGLRAVLGDPTLASLAFALLFVAFWAGIVVWMDRRGVYFKI